MKFLIIQLLLVVFLQSSSAFNVVCEFEDLLLFYELKAVYTCKVNYLKTTEEERNVSHVTGRHKARHANRDVIQIQITQHHHPNTNDQLMEYFPRGFNSIFENVVAFHAGTNRLKYLEKSDLKEFGKLKYLYLYNNQLEVLQSDVFQYNPALEYVSFFNNNLVYIGSKALIPLKQLKHAYFNKNICIDKQATTSQGLSELRLEISHQCSEITDEDLMNILKLNHMKMTKLETKVNQLSEQLASIIELLKAENKIVV